MSLLVVCEQHPGYNPMNGAPRNGCQECWLLWENDKAEADYYDQMSTIEGAT